MEKFTYNYEAISATCPATERSKNLSACTADVSVYWFSNVDAFGAQALAWCEKGKINGESAFISWQELSDEKGNPIFDQYGNKVSAYINMLSNITNDKDMWLSINSRYLTPKA